MTAAADTWADRPDLAALNDPTPHARLLSNGRYTVLLSGAGTGYSAYDGYALTNWTPDRTEDAQGFFIYLRDVERGHLWSIGHQPVRPPVEHYAAGYRPGQLWIEWRDDGIAAHLEVCVAPDAAAEIRRLVLRNLSNAPRHLEVTTYAEIALNDPAAHAAHPAFSKLFVQTDFDGAAGVLFARRRPRSAAENHPWLVHALHGPGALEHETDRARFLGRCRTAAAPVALTAAPLSGTVGSVLDPIFSLRRAVALPPGATVTFVAILAAGANRDRAAAAVGHYHEAAVVDAAFAAATAHERDLTRRLALSAARAEYWQEVAAAMHYGHPGLRADEAALRRAGSAGAARRFGLRSGAFLVVADDPPPARLRDVLRAHAYWQAKGLAVDLLILSDDAAARQATGVAHVSVRPRGEPSPAERDELLAAAHLVVTTSLPRLAAGAAPAAPRAGAVPPAADAEPGAAFPNGYGSFEDGGRAYVIRRRPPLPWINVVANETFGFLVSERGAGYTWSRNSRENRLTPWSNDPIGDPHGEALYVRDEEAATFWSPQPGPAPAPAGYEARHEFGCSRWRLVCNDLEQEVVQFVPRHDPVKVTRLWLTNTAARPRRLALYAYQRLVMGVQPEDAARGIVTAIDSVRGVLTACRRSREDFADAVVFAAAAPPDGCDGVTVTADRTRFIGRNGSPAAPAALSGGDLDGGAGAGLDPCAAVRVCVRVPPHTRIECAFLFGEAGEAEQAAALIGRYRTAAARDTALDEVRHFWTDTLSAVHVETPAPALDLMVNGWLLYQTVACRLWGRSAFYQSGGAFGFRDQLQDATALIYARPDLTRSQLLLHAAHQFVEGDVLHWWHPPAGRGIRTRFADDLLWLPFLTAFYVGVTGDWDILDEPADFLTARVLAEGEDEAYLSPAPAGAADLYTHCCRALDRSLTVGAHGLPLMGSGDWNDGMNRIGRAGRGESVWMGFFLYRVLADFLPLVGRRRDGERQRRYAAARAALRTALDQAGWDGQWYRRAYYDDGTPLGTADDAECRIDALVQAWAVLSRAAPPARAAQALAAVEHQLMARDAGLIHLLWPPFDRDPRDPGYIKGYLPGIRENGGQYTHAAVWVVQALAELGRRDLAAAALEMLGPVHHSRTAEQVACYRVEPYVVAADIYGAPPHLGRGGWTWYTGSAGWMYRVAIESILGLRLAGGDTLWLRPCVPDAWPEYRMRYRRPDGATVYDIVVRHPAGTRAAVVHAVVIDAAAGVVVDGAARVPLARDGRRHQVVVTLGDGPPPSAAPSAPNRCT